MIYFFLMCIRNELLKHLNIILSCFEEQDKSNYIVPTRSLKSYRNFYFDIYIWLFLFKLYILILLCLNIFENVYS